ncbi:MAG: ATP-grasp ribosomal peptide maturase [Pseudonocardiales bacterium]|nr:ATP-grasp ribosomal peptide maturase [Pseudonocardiales bacterium]MBV9029775.1 ATP-grasp ribosomal peptide maturase [Pseudonocardiales bacterium]
MTVLVLAREFDPTADAVVTVLGERGVPVFRTDLAAFPTHLRLDARLAGGRWTGRLWNAHHAVALEEIRSIWNRSPATYRFPDTLTAAEREFCYREAKLGVGGVLAALDVLWANHPNRCADAIFKPYQWKTAADCGLAVADTTITNDIDTARRFVSDTPHATITKALGPSGITEHDQVQVAYTRRLTDADLTGTVGVAATATTLQRFVPKAFDVRLTVIGQDLFPVAIHADSEDARVDWRCDPAALRYELVAVPDPVAEAIGRYMKRTNLVYAGFDFVVTPAGEWVMLEANTGPQIGWLEAATGAPLTDAMATLLAKGTT